MIEQRGIIIVRSIRYHGYPKCHNYHVMNMYRIEKLQFSALHYLRAYLSGGLHSKEFIPQFAAIIHKATKSMFVNSNDQDQQTSVHAKFHDNYLRERAL